MNEYELTELYEEISEVLHDAGLTWLALQVEEQIQVGHVSEILKGENFKKRDADRDYEMRPYTPKERLHLLMNALQAVMELAAGFEHEVGEFLAQEEGLSSEALSAYEQMAPLRREYKLISNERIAQMAEGRIIMAINKVRTEVDRT